MSYVVTESVRTVKESEFNKIQWGYLPKKGVTVHEGKEYNWREAELQEAQTPGFDSAVFTQDIKYFIPEVINRQIITQAEDLRVFRNLVDVIRVNGPSESFIKEFGFQASEISEGGEVPLGKLRYEKFFINIIKVGVRPLLTYETIADGKIDIFRRHTTQAVLAMVKFEDAHGMSVLNAGVPDGSTIVGTKENDHSFTATGENLTWEEWVLATQSIAAEQLSATDVVEHPYQAAQILRLNEFRELTSASDNLGAWRIFPDKAATVMRTGQLPPILGITQWVTPNQTAGTMLFVDRKNYGALAERQPLLVETDKDIIHQMQTAVYTQRYGAGILNHDGSSNNTGLKTALA